MITASYCPNCMREITATVERNGMVYVCKECPECGQFRGLAEKDVAFYDSIKALPAIPDVATTLFVDVTNECNMTCDGCYHAFATGDIARGDIDVAIQESDMTHVALTGGEPTTRDDLPDIVRHANAGGKHVTVMTNGLRLADLDYAKELVGAGPASLNISFHADTEHRDAKIAALENLMSLRFYNSCMLGRSVHSLEEIPEFMELAFRYRALFHHVRIRPVVDLWNQRSRQDIFLSDMFRFMTSSYKGIAIIPGLDNNIYHVNTIYLGLPVRLIVWPTIYNVELSELHCGPYYHVSGEPDRNVVVAMMRKGEKGG